MTPTLCLADDATFWPWHRWPDFARWPDRDATVVVVPLAGCADWGLDAPLDAEETVALAVLAAAAPLRAGKFPLLVLPPLRFVLGPTPECAFAVDPPLAHAFIAETAASIAAAGFRRIVLYNASPWNEELIDAAARDLRIERGLQMFCVNLSALGLDFDAARSGDRRALRSLLATLPASSPELTAAAARLAALLGEIAARQPLPHGGVIPPSTPCILPFPPTAIATCRR
jgi:creatinine amidohydrolase